MRPGQEVLFVDDAEMMRSYIATQLRREGFTVVEVGIVREAEEAIDRVADSEGARAIGAVLLDGRFLFDDERDDQDDGYSFSSARAVVERLRTRRIGATIFGFSASPMERDKVGLTNDDPNPFRDLCKGKATRQQIIDALNEAS